MMQTTRFSEIPVLIHQLRGVAWRKIEVVISIMMGLFRRTFLMELRNEEGFVLDLRKERENFQFIP
jgi:hypothetical protein